MAPHPQRLRVTRQSWALSQPFAISRGSKTSADVVVAEVSDGEYRGRGECVPYQRFGESVDGVFKALEAMSGAVFSGLERDKLQSVMPPGAARNALDAAFWDLDAKRMDCRVIDLAGIAELKPMLTAYTLALDTPEHMGEAAAQHCTRPLLKLKVAGEGDLDRVEAVRRNAPAARLIVDANESWTAQQYGELAPALADLGVALIEQPFPADDDDALSTLPHPVPVCADESCHTTADLDRLVGKYDAVNIKLDKTGGLTEALLLAAAAHERGFAIMVGCMIGTSLSMAPATLVAQQASLVDLDGPLLLASDRARGLRYDGSTLYPPDPALWG
ncbi:MAG TPA: N-acetyl-D-Glu racemase DgcA [Stellaceae bacterium]|jgi:L-alanine-DL-glutamate epimerase-like enolase superfamily enzyme|nr:N-acetyl-D-Glu racemase DgcA [Stellaceae bacterium]